MSVYTDDIQLNVKCTSHIHFAPIGAIFKYYV